MPSARRVLAFAIPPLLSAAIVALSCRQEAPLPDPTPPAPLPAPLPGASYPLTKCPGCAQATTWARVVGGVSADDTIEITADSNGALITTATIDLPDGGLPIIIPQPLHVIVDNDAGNPVPVNDAVGNASLALISSDTAIIRANTGAPLAVQGGSVSADILSIGGQDYKGHSFEINVNDAGVVGVQDQLSTSVTPAGLSNAQVICAGPCAFQSAACWIDPSASTQVYYVLAINAASLPADGAVSLLYVGRIDHTMGGAADQFSFSAGLAGTPASTGVTIALSNSFPNLSHIAQNVLACSASTSPAR